MGDAFQISDELFSTIVEETKKEISVLGRDSLVDIVENVIEKHFGDKGLSGSELGDIYFQVTYAIMR